MIEQSLLFFFVGMIGTVAFVRVYLSFSPKTNVYIGGYNVHHLYTGAFFLIIFSIATSAGLYGPILSLLMGIASGLITDQLIYLVVSGGGHRAYFERTSLLGMVILVLIFLVLGIGFSILLK